MCTRTRARGVLHMAGHPRHSFALWRSGCARVLNTCKSLGGSRQLMTAPRRESGCENTTQLMRARMLRTNEPSKVMISHKSNGCRRSIERGWRSDPLQLVSGRIIDTHLRAKYKSISVCLNHLRMRCTVVCSFLIYTINTVEHV